MSLKEAEHSDYYVIVSSGRERVKLEIQICQLGCARSQLACNDGNSAELEARPLDSAPNCSLCEHDELASPLTKMFVYNLESGALFFSYCQLSGQSRLAKGESTDKYLPRYLPLSQLISLSLNIRKTSSTSRYLSISHFAISQQKKHNLHQSWKTTSP